MVMLMLIQLIILESFNKKFKNIQSLKFKNKNFKNCANIDAVNKFNTGLYSFSFGFL